jgi:ABC-2 type transport system ATP-binding protein
MLEFLEVRKSYNGADPILAIDSQTLDTGIYWLQGANGTGKTTLLRMIAGIIPFKGDIKLNRRSQRQDPVAYRRLVGWADAEPLYPGFLTGEDLISFYSGILHPNPGQIVRLKEQLRIGPWLNTRLAAWSSGMTKKLALLLAFLGRPGWITLDEPLITLDEAGLAGLFILIREYHDQYDTGFLLSSHQPLPQNTLPATRNLILTNRSIELIQ